MSGPSQAPIAMVFMGAPALPGPRLIERLRLAAAAAPLFVVAADGGAAAALGFELQPDLVVGDLDSITPEVLGMLRERGVPVEQHPRDKSATDGQLALERAIEKAPSELLILGALGGERLDHGLANVLLLARLPVTATLVEERNELHLQRAGETRRWQARPGELVSLLPLVGDAENVTTRGLRWVLADDVLRFGDTRGLSNEVGPDGAEVEVALGAGLLLVTRHFPS